MKKIGIFTACALVLAFGLFSCPAAPVAPGVSLTLDKTAAVLGREANFQLHAEISDGSGASTGFSWSSSNTTVASVSSDGLVTTKQAGTTTITVSLQSDNSVTAQCSITVENGFNVSFDSNGGTLIESRIISAGSLISAPTSPTKNGFYFTAWYKDSGFTTTWNFAVDTVTAGTILYARWSYINYTITYNLNGGVFLPGTIPYSYTIDNNIALSAPGKASSFFAGWYDNAGFSGNAISEIPLGSTGNRTFYAKFLAARTITFNSNNPANQTQSFNEGETRTFNLKPIMFDYSGYKFLGWSRSASATTPEFVLPASITVGASNETFYAIWACDYLYTVNNNEVTITGFSNTWTTSSFLSFPAALEGKTVTAIGESAFQGNLNLTSVYIPGNIKTLGISCFQDCSNLETVTITTGLTTLSNFTFRNCVRLQTFYFPSSLASITMYSFMGCTGLTAFSVWQGHSAFAVESGILYNTNKTSLYFYPAAKIGATFTVPSSVNTISTLAFGNCQNLTSIIVPASVTTIGRKSFWSSVKLSSVQFLNTTPVSLISDDVFDLNPVTMQIKVPQSVLTVYKTASYWSEYASKMVGVN